MSKHFGDSYNAHLSNDLRRILRDAQRDTVLLDEIRNQTPAQRRDWLRNASTAQIDRLALCFAIEAGDASDAGAFAQRLREKKAA